MDALTTTEITPAEMAEALRGDPREISLVPEHFFAPGAYVRKLTLPAGTFAVGKKHKTTHVTVLAKGKAFVRGVNGRPDHVMQAGDVMITPAGSQRAVYVEEETVFVTMHVTSETDLEKLEREIIEAPALEKMP